MIQINKPSFAVFRLSVSRLIGISLISAGLWTSTFAQNSTRMGQVDQPVVQSAPDQIPNESTTTISADNPRELSMFFIIGIAINVIVIASFAFWFSKEWSKKRHSGDRE